MFASGAIADIADKSSAIMAQSLAADVSAIRTLQLSLAMHGHMRTVQVLFACRRSPRRPFIGHWVSMTIGYKGTDGPDAPLQARQMLALCIRWH